MEEREFLDMADAELARVEEALEALLNAAEIDWDYEVKPGGILELDFAAGGKIIINRHVAAREIWIAARSGGFHFRPPRHEGAQWLDSRDGTEMASVLSRCVSEQAGTELKLSW